MDVAAALADIDRTLIDRTPFSEGGTTAVVTASSLFHACIRRYAPPGSTYREQADRYILLSPKRSKPGDISPEQGLIGVLRALRVDVANGKLGQFEELVRANVYADLLAQAEGLLADRYARAATVVAGASLEDHIKKLASKYSLAPLAANGSPKKAAVLNSELKAAGVYAETQRATIEGWQKLRNDAAHGDPGFEPPTDTLIPNIAPMIAGIRGFLAQYPA